MPTPSAAPTSNPTPAPHSTSTVAPSGGPPIDRSQLRGLITYAAGDGIWVSNADGSDRREIIHDGGFDPTWSPDGSLIAYRRLLAADDGEIWIMNSDGTNTHDLVNDPQFSDWGPAWSPDGTTIAFDSNREVGLALWLMDADGSNQRIIGHGHGEYPAWSPDGQKIVYAGGDYYDIRVTNIDGTDDHAVVTDAAYDMGPAWSPGGQWIAYHTQADHTHVIERGMGPEMEIHLVRPDGSDDHRITNDDTEDSFPVWSPDGQFIMWSRYGELVVARPDGSGMIEIEPGGFPSWIDTP